MPKLQLLKVAALTIFPLQVNANPQGVMVQAEGYLHEAAIACDAISSIDFENWKSTADADTNFKFVSDEIAKGAALIFYETGVSDFNRYFHFDEAKACTHAINLLSDLSLKPQPSDLLEQAEHGATISEKFNALGIIEKLHTDCQKTMNMPIWSPAWMLPEGNYRQGFKEYLAGRFQVQASPELCHAVQEALR